MDLTTAWVKGEEDILMVGVVVIVVLVMDVVERRLGQGDLSRRCWRVKRRSIGIVLLLRVMQIRLLDNRAHVDIF